MPLAEEYGDQVKSKISDLKNVGARPGSAITAALFLKEFVEKVKTPPYLSPVSHLFLVLKNVSNRGHSPRLHENGEPREEQMQNPTVTSSFRLP